MSVYWTTCTSNSLALHALNSNTHEHQSTHVQYCSLDGRDALDIVAVYDNVDIADIILKRRLPDGNDVETVLFVSLSIVCMLCC